MPRRFWIEGPLALAGVIFVNHSAIADTPSLQAITPGGLSAHLTSIEKTIDKRREELHIPGASLVIVKDDKVIFIKGFGQRDIENKLPVTPSTQFAIGSTTKAFTAMLAMMSVDEGKLALTDSPKKYLPYFKLRDPEADSKITIGDLLCHRSGLDRTDIAWYTNKLSAEETIRLVGEVKPTAKFGEKFQYQNVMFLVAGQCVGVAQHSSWSRLLAHRIFEPLHMKQTNTSIGDMERAKDHARGYTYDPVKKSTVLLPYRSLPAIAPAGAINSNATDMAQWLRLLLGGGAYEGKRLVTESSFSELFKKRITVGGGADYGYGWFLRDWNNHSVIEHGGNIDGFNAQVALMPDQKLGFVLLTNVSASPLGTIAMETVWDNLVGAPKPAAGEVVAAGPKVDPALEAGTYHETKHDSASAFAAPITAEELMQKVIDAQGGEANLKRHKSLRLRASASAENQGLNMRMVVYSRAPNAEASDVTLFAGKKRIGYIRGFFDGKEGGSESSITPSAKLSGDSLLDTAIASTLFPELNWKSLFKSVTITGKEKVGEEEAYVVNLKPEKGSAVTDYVSVSSFRVLRRKVQTGGQAETYSDFRTVEGVVIPFVRTGIMPGFGETVTTVTEAKFDVKISDSIFHATPPAAGAGTN